MRERNLVTKKERNRRKEIRCEVLKVVQPSRQLGGGRPLFYAFPINASERPRKRNGLSER